MSRFNPTDKLALPSPALHLYWPPAQQQAPGSPTCQSNTQLILAVASGTEGLELYAAATLSTKRAIYIRKGLVDIGFDELEKKYEFVPCLLDCMFEILVLKENCSEGPSGFPPPPLDGRISVCTRSESTEIRNPTKFTRRCNRCTTSRLLQMQNRH